MDSQELATKYVGNAASGYDARRTKLGKWQREHAAVEELLSAVADGSRILDVPVGTGRFIPYYANRHFAVTGIDISKDMLKEASAKASSIGLNAVLQEGNIFELPCADSSFDAVVSVRMLNWFEAPQMALALKEVARASNRHVIFSMRTFAENMSAGRKLFVAADSTMRRLFSRKPHGGATTVHRKSDFHAALAAAGLKIDKQITVKAGRADTDYQFIRAVKQ